jgi:TRAP-type C4-dicarboxylate transport system permease small subunit
VTGHGIDAASAAGVPPADVPETGLPGLAQKILTPVNTLMAIVSAIALLAASCVLTWEVVGRYFLAIPSDWQDELSAILLIAATFASAGWIQARRGHVAIDALSHVLPPSVDRVRRRLAYLCAFAFCAYFAFKSFQLLHEAWDEGQTTPSAWGSPLWIPYGCMAFGMALLALQQCAQLLGARRRP